MSATPASSQREFAREELSKELLHDYSTSSTGVVPLAERRSLYHFIALWVTLAAGFTYLFLGFQYHDAGYALGKAVTAAALGAFCYLCYALPASYLGSRTGQTHSLLTRSIFGLVGSAIVSLLIGVAALSFFATPVPEVEEQAVAVATASTAAGEPPTLARRYARLIQSYELSFWNPLADGIPETA
jgi:cytosine/uracil/thiamine/allantoin permease